MILYIMRHAEAVVGNEILHDEWRYLTDKGRQTARKAAASIEKHGAKPRLTITSPLTRAVQTAEIAAEKACRKNVIIASPLLVPGADPAELVAYLKECTAAKRVLLVGHEPQLGRLVALLLGRDSGSISLAKGSYVALDINPDNKATAARFLWYFAPGRGRSTSLKKSFRQG